MCATNALKEALLMCDNRNLHQIKGSRVTRIQADGGGEFTNKQVRDLCWEKNIVLSYSPAHQPSSNGIAERMVGILKTTVRRMLKQANLGREWWSYACRFAGHMMRERVLGRDWTYPLFGQLVGIWKSHDTAQAKSLDDRGSVGYLLDIDIWQSGATRIVQDGAVIKGLAPERLDPSRYQLTASPTLEDSDANMPWRSIQDELGKFKWLDHKGKIYQGTPYSVEPDVNSKQMFAASMMHTSITLQFLEMFQMSRARPMPLKNKSDAKSSSLIIQQNPVIGSLREHSLVMANPMLSSKQRASLSHPRQWHPHRVRCVRDGFNRSTRRLRIIKKNSPEHGYR